MERPEGDTPRGPARTLSGADRQELVGSDRGCGAYRGLPSCRVSSCIASSRTAMAASAAAGNRVGAQTDGDPRPGQRIKTAGGASGGVTSSITSWSVLVMGPEARTTLG